MNTFASIALMKKRFVGSHACEQKGIVFTEKDASDLYINKMGVKDQWHLNIVFVICV